MAATFPTNQTRPVECLKYRATQRLEPGLSPPGVSTLLTELRDGLSEVNLG